MSAVLIDDEILQLSGLRQLLHIFCPTLQIIGEATSLEEGRTLLNESEPDIVFLDIVLGDGSGLDLLKNFKHKEFQVILVSAHNSFAIDAFRLSALDYLLKPINPEELQEAVQKAELNLKNSRSLLQIQTLVENIEKLTAQNRKIVLKDADNIYILTIADIVFCKADGSYTIFHTNDKREILVSKNLKEYEKALVHAHFIRCHHSYLVNLHHVVKFDKAEGGKLITQNNVAIPVASRKRDAIIEILHQIH